MNDQQAIIEQGRLIYGRPEALTDDTDALLPRLHAWHHPPADRRGDR